MPLQRGSPTPHCAPQPLLPTPRLLVVVPGHGEPSRSHVTLANLARIERMRVQHTCLMFAYGTFFFAEYGLKMLR